MKQLSPSDLITMRQLKSLLAKAQAPLTQRKVAAILTFDDGSSAVGFNTESQKGITHAEEHALRSYDGSARVKSIFLMTSGGPMAIKNALPCEMCTDLLVKKMAPSAEVVLFFNDYTGKVSLDLQTIRSGYATADQSLSVDSLDKTLLSELDKKIVHSVVKTIKERDTSIDFYLTGSSAGQGHPTTLLAQAITGAPYWDIDLVAVHPKGNAANIHQCFQSAYNKSLFEMGFNNKVLSRSEPSYRSKQGWPDSSDFLFHRLYWPEGQPTEIQPPDYKKDTTKPSPLDLSAGRTLETIITPRYLKRRWYTRLEMKDSSLPTHMQYTFVQRLTAPKPSPALLARYLEAIVSNDEAFASAVASMVRIPVGFNTLYVSKNPRLQLNFYREDITGNEDPHGHPAWARTTWYAPRGAIQEIVFHQPLPKTARRLRGLPIQELRTMSLTNIQTSTGGRPFYGLKPLEPTLVLKRSTVRKATLSGEDFPPWDPHNVTVGNLKGRVAISTHYKKSEEPAALSTFEGLVNYKGLSPDEAMQVQEFRTELSKNIQNGLMPGATRLGPAAVVYTPLDRKIEDMEPLPVHTPPKLAEELILGGLRTARELARKSA